MAKDRDGFSNIFEAASKMPDKKDATSKGSAAQSLTDEEIRERFERYKELHSVIQGKLDKAFHEHNLTQNDVLEYFDNRAHFNDKQWRLIQEQKEETKEKLTELVKKKKKTLEEKKAAAKGQKPKSMQTKSRWIQM